MIDGFQIFDPHVHSPQSACADRPPGYTAELVLRRAKTLGFDGVGFSDHILEPQPTLPQAVLDFMAPRKGFERIDALRRDLARIDRTGPPEISVGSEGDYWGNGHYSVSPEGRTKLDHFVLSCNHLQCPTMPAPAGDEPEDVARHLLEKTSEAVASGLATSLGHPLIAMHWPRPAEVYALYPRLGVAALFEQARDAGVAIGFCRQFITVPGIAGREDIETVYQLAVRVGVRLAFETDCHQLRHLDTIFPLIELARSIGLQPRHFITGFPLA